MIDVDVRVKRGSFQLDARFSAGAGVTALYGPSGAGKTTIVHLLAGLIAPDDGRITIRGTTVVDTARHLFVPPHRRQVGCVFQESRLFPHLDVRRNLRYGWRLTKPSARTVRWDDVIELLELGPLLGRATATLSGGERQRVALGRALLASPRVLLLDEPLAAVDIGRREEILPYIERIREEGVLPIVYVSHSVAEVARVASRVVLLRAGRVDAIGSVSDVLGALDLVTGQAADAGVVLDGVVESHDPALETSAVRTPAGLLRMPQLAFPIGARVRVRVRADDVLIGTEAPSGLSALNVIEATVGEVRDLASGQVRLRLAAQGAALIAHITRHSARLLRIEPGVKVFAIIKAVALDRSNPRDIGPSS